ncbi:PREDICTED: suppressor protein SRP40-like [Rhagoletis zephyria]|uniref:suppressor protein SRP40-like n=1 Tax=Rhagoletis zephyria TaxID=28612 RepID=UPI00081175B7|nr:PREDICTED: suppressor protein SRP40-like [Rhagoletis zephyria]
MRPGPGLVVMALAFISGARRGSTSTSSKSSSSTTSTSSTFFTSTPLDNSPEPTTPSLLFPAYLGGGGVPTVESKASPNHPQQEAEGKKYHIENYNYLYKSFLYLPPFAPPIEGTTHDVQHLRLETLSGLKSSSRATRQTRIIRDLTEDESNQKKEIDGGGGNADTSAGSNVSKRGSGVGSESGSGYDIEDGPTSTEDKTNEFNEAASTSASRDSQGLPVKFASNPSDASQSFDEDDILALVAEDDLLSEESFDRLTKFTNDKLGYVIVDDYDASNKDSISGVSESSLTSAVEDDEQHPQDHNYTANERNTGIEIGIVENDDFQHEEEHANEKNEVKINVKTNINQYAKENVYSGQKENNYKLAIGDISYVAAISDNGLSHTIAADSDISVPNTKWSIFESESPLTRLNPWISACDLAQPGTAPDLQPK